MDKKTIVFATSNKGKLNEIKEIFKDSAYEIISMKDAGVDIDIDENGSTFEENAFIKATAVYDITGGIVMADDSGLEVDYLEKKPGVFSSRYMGKDTPYEVKNLHILELLKDVPDNMRSARFVSAICCIMDDGEALKTTQTLEGKISHEILGAEGFGYDPIVYIPGYGKTCAQLSIEEKNKISHRGKALRQMKIMLNRKLEEGPDR